MSIIQTLEQLGANSSLHQLTFSELKEKLAVSSQELTMLDALMDGDADKLSQLLEVPVYRCIMQVPAQPAKDEEEEDVTLPEKPVQISNLH